MLTELNEVEQESLNKVAGLKQYEVYATELVYHAKKVWAKDEEDAQRIANEEGFTNFEITEVEEVV